MSNFFRKIQDGFRTNPMEPHIKKGYISRFALKSGDLFLEYDNERHKGIRFAQKILNPTHIKYSNFVHGGIILSNTELIHADGIYADGSSDLHIAEINDVLDHKEYRIFRPCNEDLAKEIVEVAKELKETRIIAYPKYEHSLLSKSKTNRSLFSFSNKSKHVKDLDELQNEMFTMINRAEYDAFMRSKQIKAYRQALYQSIKAEYHDALKNATSAKKDEIDEEIENKVEKTTTIFTLNDVFKSKKKFFCTQFVTWVVQMAAGKLKLQGKFAFKITDVLNIRDTKATPAHLAEILKKSSHFVEYKSLEKNIKPQDR